MFSSYKSGLKNYLSSPYEVNNGDIFWDWNIPPTKKCTIWSLVIRDNFCMHPANERRCYNVTLPLTGWGIHKRIPELWWWDEWTDVLQKNRSSECFNKFNLNIRFCLSTVMLQLPVCLWDKARDSQFTMYNLSAYKFCMMLFSLWLGLHLITIYFLNTVRCKIIMTCNVFGQWCLFWCTPLEKSCGKNF